MRKRGSRFKPALIFLVMLLFISQSLSARAESLRELVEEFLAELQTLEEAVARKERKKHLQKAQHRLSPFLDWFIDEAHTWKAPPVFDPLADYAGRTTLSNLNVDGKLLSVTKPDGAVSAYSYNADNLLTAKTDSLDRTTQFQYVTYGRLTKFISPAGEESSYQPSYTEALLNNLPEEVGTSKNPASPVTAEAQTRVRTDGNGNTTTYKLNKYGAAIEETDALGNATYYERNCTCGSPSKTTHPKGWVVSMTYEAKGDLLTKTEEAAGATTSYSYDNAGRLLALAYQLGATNVAIFSYSYDPVGNRHPAGKVYNAANQLIEYEAFIYSYDKNGNTISKIGKISGEYTRYGWNAENQLKRIEKFAQAGKATPTFSSSYLYDGLDKRVAKIVDGVVTKYLYDNEDILLELDEQDNVIARYTHGPGIDEPIALQRDTNLDGTLGVLCYHVTAGMGGFLNEDPIGFAGGVKIYTYVGNNPVNFADPMGLKRCVSWGEGKDCFAKCVDILTFGTGNFLCAAVPAWIIEGTKWGEIIPVEIAGIPWEMSRLTAHSLRLLTKFERFFNLSQAMAGSLREFIYRATSGAVEFAYYTAKPLMGYMMVAVGSCDTACSINPNFANYYGAFRSLLGTFLFTPRG